MSEQEQTAGEELGEGLILPDLSEAVDFVEPGVYSTRIIGHKMGKWDGKGDNAGKVTRFIDWELQTFNELDPKNNGRKIFHKTPINGKGAFQFQKFYTGTFGVQYVPSAEGFNPSMFHGREIEVTVVQQVDYKTKQPTEYTEVKAVKPIKGAEVA